MRMENPAEKAAQTEDAVQTGTTDSRVRTPLWVRATVAALFSGGLMLACYWPVELHFAVWFALVPWLFGTLLGLFFYRLGLNWGFFLNGPAGKISKATPAGSSAGVTFVFW